jgi:hypothetical protein
MSYFVNDWIPCFSSESSLRISSPMLEMQEWPTKALVVRRGLSQPPRTLSLEEFVLGYPAGSDFATKFAFKQRASSMLPVIKAEHWE